jgi:DNA-directed RNA polymerase subunit RPC12/RpoP
MSMTVETPRHVLSSIPCPHKSHPREARVASINKGKVCMKTEDGDWWQLGELRAPEIIYSNPTLDYDDTYIPHRTAASFLSFEGKRVECPECGCKIFTPINSSNSKNERVYVCNVCHTRYEATLIEPKE